MTCRDGYCSQSQSTSKGTVLSESFPIASSIQSGRRKVETERLLENIEVSANSHEETDSSDTADILTHSIASFARRYLAIAFGESMNAASGDAEQIITAKM